MATALAALTAVGAATLLGGSSVAQRRAMGAVATHAAGDPRLVAALARRGWWWAGTLAALAGLGLQVLALALGPLVTVQATMTSSIVAATLAEWWLLGRRPAPASWVGITLIATGLVTALLALAPQAGAASTLPSSGVDVTAAAVCLAVIAVAVGLDRFRTRPGRSATVRPSTGLGLAVATGLGYGFTAMQLKSVGMQLGGGVLAPLAHPAVYLALLVGPLSILLSQSALQRGHRVVAVVSLILVTDPLVGLIAGGLWFGEHVATTPSALAVAGAAAVALVAGIVLTQTGAVPITGATEVGAGFGTDRQAGRWEYG